jgi:hypothetical protein
MQAVNDTTTVVLLRGAGSLSRDANDDVRA